MRRMRRALPRLALGVFLSVAFGGPDLRAQDCRHPRYDEVFQKGTHNSYWIDATSGHRDAFAAGPRERLLDQLLFEHVRSVELDLHFRDGDPGEYDVYHTDMPENASCHNLADCLQILQRFDRMVPDHEVVTVILEFKEAALPLFWNGHDPKDIDRLLWEHLGRSCSPRASSWRAARRGPTRWPTRCRPRCARA
jgi:hypothetical protein